MSNEPSNEHADTRPGPLHSWTSRHLLSAAGGYPPTPAGRRPTSASLLPGDVLVCPTTSAAWTILFAIAGALVTDCGGPLAHAAIIAREHGLPAVVGTVDATTKLKNGQLVTVDGTTGAVTLHLTE